MRDSNSHYTELEERWRNCSNRRRSLSNSSEGIPLTNRKPRNSNRAYLTKRRDVMYRTVIVTMIMGLNLIMAGCQSMTGKTAGQTVDDATITASVQKTLTADRISNFSRIDVDTDRGEVSLNGVVQSMDARARAADLAGG